MDRVDRYRDILRRVIEDYASVKYSYGNIRSEVVIDPVHDHYELMAVGWDDYRRIHSPVLHLDLIDGKIWVQFDGTNRSVVAELEAAGVPKEDIVLAFHSPHMRKHTGYAVG